MQHWSEAYDDDPEAVMTAFSGRSRREKPDPSIAETFWKNGAPVNKVYEFNKLKVTAPRLPPLDSPIEQMDQAYETFIARVNRTNAQWSEKLGILEIALDPLCTTVVHDTSVITRELKGHKDRYKSDVFTFVKAQPVNESYKKLHIGCGAMLPDDTREEGAWVEWTVEVNPRNSTVNDPHVTASKFPAARTITVYTALPYAKTADLVHDAITPDHFRGDSLYRDLLNLCMRGTTEDTGPIQLLKRSENNTGYPTIQNMEVWTQAILMETRVEAIQMKFRAFYIGDRGGLLSIPQRLMLVKQREYDPVTKAFKISSVREFQNKIGTIMRAIDEENPPSDMPVLSKVVYAGLTEALQIRVQKKLPSHVERILANYDKNLENFHEFLDLCLSEERKLQAMSTAIEAQTGGAKNRSIAHSARVRGATPGTFHTVGQDAGARISHQESGRGYQSFVTIEIPEEAPMTVPTHLVDESREGDVGASKQIDVFHFLAKMQEDEMALEEEEPSCFASTAEDALRTASGSRYPLVCFGCGQRGHSFRACPQKDDPAILEKFQQNWDKFRRERKEQRDRKKDPNNIVGFFTPEIKKTFLALNHNRVSGKESEKLLVTLAKQVQQAIAGKEAEPVACTARKQARHFLCFDARSGDGGRGQTFLAQERSKLEFAINPQLPFLIMPIGLDIDDGYDLKGLYDTGGCCTMGWLSYHLKIAKDHPQIVKEVIVLEEQRFEPIKIGGIEGSVKITHIIVYYLPWRTSTGEHDNLSVGLTETLPLNTLYGLPFIVKAGLTPRWDQQVIHSHHFQNEFQLVMERPGQVPLEELDHQTGPKKAFLSGQGELRQVDTQEDLLA